MQSDDKEWEFFTSAAEGYPVVICGLNVWDYEWRCENAQRIVITDPLYPDETKDLTIYSMCNGKKTVRFAASEFTASVYGFCIPSKPLWQRIISKFL